MDILGVGLPELVFIFIIALLVLGPRDMQKAGKTMGRWLNRLINSDAWKVFRQSSAELRNLPTNLMRDANLEMKRTDDEIRKAMSENRNTARHMVPMDQNRIDPAANEKKAEDQPAAPVKEANSAESEPRPNA
jgi:sec-independent protein translocase protein TatA